MNFEMAIGTLKELGDDSCIPRNVKTKLMQVIGILEKNGESSLKVSQALHELEEITEDVNMQSDTRTSIYNVVSLLETIKG